MLKTVKASFRNTTNEQRKAFKNAHCLLTISVGQETHEDERFVATMALIRDSFDTCIITLHDSLQRYTIALDKDKNAEDYHVMAVALGDAWLARNEKFYQCGSKKVSIIRWDAWLSDSNYPHAKNKVIATLDSDPTYRAAFEKTIEDYLPRYTKRLQDPSSFNLMRARQLCFDYLVEECAVLCLWPQTRCEFEIYSSKHNEAMQETFNLFLKDSTHYVRPIRIGFNYRPNLQPQCF